MNNIIGDNVRLNGTLVQSTQNPIVFLFKSNDELLFHVNQFGDFLDNKTFEPVYGFKNCIDFIANYKKKSATRNFIDGDKVYVEGILQKESKEINFIEIGNTKIKFKNDGSLLVEINEKYVCFCVGDKVRINGTLFKSKLDENMFEFVTKNNNVGLFTIDDVGRYYDDVECKMTKIFVVKGGGGSLVYSENDEVVFESILQEDKSRISRDGLSLSIGQQCILFNNDGSLYDFDTMKHWKGIVLEKIENITDFERLEKIKPLSYLTNDTEFTKGFCVAFFCHYLINKLNYSERTAMKYAENVKVVKITKGDNFGKHSAIILEINKPFHVDVKICLDNPEDNPYWMYKILESHNFDLTPQ